MAVTVVNDDSVFSSANAAGLLVSFDAGSGSNRCLAAVSAEDRGTTLTQTVTYNSVSMTAEITAGTSRDITLFSLAAPATGFNDLEMTNVEANAACFLCGIALEGVDQTTPVDATNSSVNSGSSQSSTVSSAVGDLCVDGIIVAVDTPTADSGQTVRGTVSDIGNSDVGASSEPGAASVTMGWSWATSKINRHVIANFQAAVAAPGGRIMASLVGAGGLAGRGGIAGQGGGLAA